MYQLIVIVMQFCFAYPKNKPSIDVNQQSDQMTTPDAIKSSRLRRRGDKDEDEVELDGLTVDTNGEGGNFKGGNETKLSSTNNQGATFTQPPTSASSLTTIGSPGCPLPVTEVVKKNFNITVSYNPPSTKSLFNSFDQLRSSRPNCFISSIIRGDGQPSSLPGFTVKTTEIKSPEEVTGVKSPSPEAWRVAIDTGGGINWTQTKPPATPTGNNVIVNETSDDKVFFYGKKCQPIN